MRITNVQAIVYNDGVRDILLIFATDRYGDLWVKEGLDGEWQPVEGPDLSTPRSQRPLAQILKDNG